MSNAPDPAAALAAMYPSAAKPDGTATPAAKATSSAAPSGSAAQPATGPAPATPAVPAQGAKQAPETPAAGEVTSPAAAALFGTPASSGEVREAMELPDDPAAAGFDTSPDGAAVRSQLASAFQAFGASREEVQGFWKIAAAAVHPSAQPHSYEEGEKALRAAWPAGEYEQRLARARNFMSAVGRRAPRALAEVKALGLDNSAAFIIALEASARRRRR